MKKIAVCLALGLGLIPIARAQVSVEIVMEQEHFLVGETIPVAVRVTNRSGQTLRLGDEPDWLTFTLQSRDGLAVPKNGEVPVLGEFHLESGKVATRRVDLTPYFILNQVGRYQLNANVQIKAWDSTLSATPKSFDVIKGAKLWSQEFGMLLPPGVTNRPPEVRRYSLEQANYLRTQLRMYLRITDADDSHVIKVLPIGPMVSISNPERQVDRSNNLHILYQAGARSYLYAVVSPEGEMLVRQNHEITTSRPRLRQDDQGRFGVMGGARRHSKNDLPAPLESESNVSPTTP